MHDLGILVLSHARGDGGYRVILERKRKHKEGSKVLCNKNLPASRNFRQIKYLVAVAFSKTDYRRGGVGCGSPSKIRRMLLSHSASVPIAFTVDVDHLKTQMNECRLATRYSASMHVAFTVEVEWKREKNVTRYLGMLSRLRLPKLSNKKKPVSGFVVPLVVALLSPVVCMYELMARSCHFGLPNEMCSQPVLEL